MGLEVDDGECAAGAMLMTTGNEILHGQGECRNLFSSRWTTLFDEISLVTFEYSGVDSSFSR